MDKETNIIIITIVVVKYHGQVRLLVLPLIAVIVIITRYVILGVHLQRRFLRLVVAVVRKNRKSLKNICTM